MRFDGKVAMVTGSAAGLGRVMAEQFAAEGARVIVADVADGADTVSGITDAGGTAMAVSCDVTDSGSVADAVAATLSAYGRLDVLVNNAGVMLSGDDGPETTSEDVFAATMDVNVRGVFLCCRHAIPAMLDPAKDGGPGGSIVSIASFVAFMGAATPQIAYTASKGAVVSMTREVAMIYARRGLRANSICPGPVLTPLLAKFLEDDDARHRRLVHIPMGRFGTPIDIARPVLFLASDDASFVTGANLLVDGGITAAYTTPLDSA
jgi:NAD(P)-dependent dehydrogenase (short-subunit alcohol dehydrogenase family)